MKNLTTILGLTFMSLTAFGDNVVKTCHIDAKIPGESRAVSVTYNVVKNGSELIGKTTQVIDGTTKQLPDEAVTFGEFAVRENLSADLQDMNEAEQLIQGTSEFLSVAEMGSAFDVGVNLKAIRHAKLFQLGKFTHMGGMVIIEAQDSSGKTLGSFVTGFLPFACKQ